MDLHADPLSLLRTRTSEKWTAYPPDVLPLFVAEMDFPLAEPIAEALTAAIRRSDTGYDGGSTELPEAFAGFALRHWNWAVDPAQVSTTTDVSVTIVESLRLAISPGDGVVLNPPVYAPFFDLIAEAGGMPVEVPLLDTGDAWALDLEAIEHAFIAGARGYLLCHPHNPLGLVHSAEQLRNLAELAAKYDVTVISDEIHAPLTYSATGFTPFLSVSDAAREHGIAVTSASKSWNVAGLKCALFVTASDRMSHLLSQLPEEVHFRTSLFGRIASVGRFHRRRPVAGCREARAGQPTAPCSARCSTSTCPRSDTGRRRPATSPGWTSARWAGATIRRSGRWSRRGWRSTPAPASAPRGAASCA